MVAPLDVRAVAAVLGVHRVPVEFADRLVRLRCSQQLDRRGDGQLVGGQVVGHAGGVVAALDVRAVLAGLDHDDVAVVVGPQWERVDLGGVDLVEVLLDQPLEAQQGVVAEAGLGGDRLGVAVAGVAEVEALQPLVLGPGAARDVVEVGVDRRGEVVVDERVEVLLEQPDDGERRPGRHQRLALLPHVAAVLDRLDDRRPRRRPTDAQLLEPLDERRLGVARRRRGGVPVRGDRGDRYLVALGERRQERLVVGGVLAGLLLRGDVHGAVAGEGDRRARGGELAVGDLAGGAVGGVGGDAHADGDTRGVGHL